MRHRFTPAGLLILGGILAAGVFGIDTRRTLAFQFFALSAIIMMIAIISTITFRNNFRLRRHLPQFGTQGQPLHYQVSIENLNPSFQEDLILIDELDSPFPSFSEFISSSDSQDKNRNWFDRKIGYPKLVSLLHKKRGASISPLNIRKLAPNEQTDLGVELLPIRRGYLHLAQSRVARPDPFGLFRAFHTTQQKDTLLILPKTYDAPAIHLSGSRKYQQGGLNQASLIGDSQEFLSLRDYRPGDPLRSIHWRSYAKLAKPIVKEFQDEFLVRQGLVLDTFIENASELLFEEAVSVAASFAVSIHEQDSMLDLMFVGTQAYRFSTGRGVSQTENMLEVLACVEPCHDAPFVRLEQLLKEHVSETSGLICVLLDWDKKRQDLLAQLMISGTPVYVFLISEDGENTEYELGPLQEQPDRFVVLNPGSIQQQLDRLT